MDDFACLLCGSKNIYKADMAICKLCYLEKTMREVMEGTKITIEDLENTVYRLKHTLILEQLNRRRFT